MEMNQSDVILATAAILGPVLAVAATRVVDIWRDRSNRRYSIFVALMATRRASLNAAHVEAINKIEVEFANDRDVIQCLRRYMDLLEEPTANTPEGELVLKRRRRAFAELIQAIGGKLGRRIDKNDFLEGGYLPQGWADFEDLQLANMREMNKILNMQKPFLVLTQTFKPETQATNPNSKYPPPPEG